MLVRSGIALCLSLGPHWPEIDNQTIARAPESLITTPINPNNIRIRPSVWVAPGIEETIGTRSVDHKTLFVFVLIALIISTLAGQLYSLEGYMSVLFKLPQATQIESQISIAKIAPNVAHRTAIKHALSRAAITIGSETDD